MLNINGLKAHIDGREILKGIHLEIKPGEIHAIMGPNGAGKSTLASVLAGSADYEATGIVTLDGQDIMELSPEERSHRGLFMSFQYPLEIPGITNEEFLYYAHKAHAKAKGITPLIEKDFEERLDEVCALVDMDLSFKDRMLNEGFSGGEKKKNEILQLLLLNPSYAILDETDSGLDIDAMRIVARGVSKWHGKDKGLMLITHYKRLLEYIKPDFIHVMVEGFIVKSGTFELADILEKQGYEAFESLV